MKCPFCSATVHEHLAKCQECGFTLLEVQRVFGVASTLEPGVTDFQEVLSKREVRSLRKRLGAFQHRFPQCRFSIVTQDHPSPRLPMLVFAFWLFNTSGLSRKIDKGGNNHDLLLVVDTNLGAAGMVVGYGLEPFVGQKQIGDMLAAGQQEFKESKWLPALEAIIDSAESHLAEICSGIDQIFGINTKAIYEEDMERRGELVRPGEW